MSTALAIAGVSAVLKNLLDSGLIDHQVADVLGATILVSSLSPDVVPIQGPEPRLNLFFYQATPNAAWRNVDLPSRNPGGQRISSPPLALDLHYLLTAYGMAELQAEVLLGYGLQLLHENPVLSRAAIRAALNNPSPLSGALLQALRSADLAEQVEMLKIAPLTMNSEEMSRLWSALTAHYRPTYAFQVSVVLIEARAAAISPLPVLTRGQRIPPIVPGEPEREEGVKVAPDMVPPYPTLETVVVAAHSTPSTLQLGDVVKVSGHHLAGTNRTVVLRNDHFRVEQEIALADGTDEAAFVFTVPDLPGDLPVGIYQLELRVLRSGDAEPRTSNPLPVALAPAITFPPLAMTRGMVNGTPNVLSLRIGCQPEVRVGQQVTLLMDSREAPALPFTANTATLDFQFADAPPAGGTPLLRLKVDGIESIVVNRNARPPEFFNHRITLPI